MRPDVFTALDREWGRWCRPPATATAFSRWAAAEPAVGDVRCFDALVAMFERPGAASHQVRDEVMLALLRLARHDADAYRTLLHVLRAGLVNLRSRARRWWDAEEAASVVLAAAAERIGRYPMHRRSKVAANLLGDMWHSVWVQRQADLRREAAGDEPVEAASLWDLPCDDEVPGAAEVLALVGEAVRRGRVSRRDGRLVALHRVFGLTNVEVAGVEGCRPCTVRKRRVAAEAAIAELAVA